MSLTGCSVGCPIGRPLRSTRRKQSGRAQGRGEPLDASRAAIRERKVVLSRRVPLVGLFARQMASDAKVLDEDEETGAKKYRYVRTGEDHFSLARRSPARAERCGLLGRPCRFTASMPTSRRSGGKDGGALRRHRGRGQNHALRVRRCVSSRSDPTNHGPRA